MNRILLLVAAVSLGAVFTGVARADQWDKRTTLTVSQPIQVPGAVLQPGTYVLKLADSSSNRHIVQVFNGRQDHLETTILAIPNYRLQPRGKTEFAWWETPAGQPRALRAWFYPGDNYGQEFTYPKGFLNQIASVTPVSVPPQPAVTESVATREVEVQTPTPVQEAPAAEVAPEQPQPVETAQNTTPEPAQVASPAPVHTPTDEGTRNRTLPASASPYPLFGLGGLSALMVGMLVRRLATSHS